MSRNRAPAPARRWQRGALAVEAALALPILIAAGLIGSDMQRIHTERIRLENAAATMALNLAAQPELSAAGLDALAEAAMQGHEQNQQLIVLDVLQSGRIAWALQRGGDTGLCEAPAAGGHYSDELPESLPEDARDEDEDGDASGLAMIVVVACRATADVALSGALVMPELLRTTSLYRATHKTITLDTTLQAESDASGLAYSESDS